jgi:alkylation response protein AidB-like acyl-CoA dehydrogenase
MQFGLNESQELLRSNARKFFAAECPMEAVRKLMETETAFDEALWAKMAEQGYTGIIFPEEFGGVGLGTVDLILLMEEAGRALLPGPLFSTVALAGAAINAVASAEQKKKYLEPICEGTARATLAYLEAAADWDASALTMTATSGKLNGEKLFVTDAAVADLIVVAAKNGVYVVDAKAPGLKIESMKGIDMTRKIYAVAFKDTPAEKIGEVAGLAKAMNIATAALSAELVGGMQRTLDITVEYAKVRKQFGKPIGSYQAVQHQCADMYLETESARSASYYAAWTLQENVAEAPMAAAIAKMYASDAGRTVGNRGIQVHGGMGFTWENDIQLYYKRAKASETMLGDASFHRDRIARLTIDQAACETAKSA